MSCDNKMNFAYPEWGFDGTNDFNTLLKQKYRWRFKIPNITTGVTTSLPCIRAARPKFQFREMQAEHLNEVISFPSKPEWQPINLTVYDRCINSQNPIFTWLKAQYNPSPYEVGGCGSWWPTLMGLSFKVCANLELYDGCGNVIEAWTLDQAYPQSIDWGDLEMSSNEIVTVDFTLRYDRAYQIYPIPLAQIYTFNDTQGCGGQCTDPSDCNLNSGNASSTVIPPESNVSIGEPFPPESSSPGTTGSVNISITPDLSDYSAGADFYTSALGTVTPYTSSNGPNIYLDEFGNYWKSTGRIGDTKAWSKWNGSTGEWGLPTINPKLQQFAPVITGPDFILV